MQRKSKQKETILKALKDTDSHPTAEDIYEQVKREIPHISLGTVYRNLKLLKQGGDIVELDLAGTLSRFDGHTHPHHHFRCEQCERVFDVDEPMDKAIDSRVAQRTGFKVTYHRLEFRGLCHHCQRSNSPGSD
jgi:Fe2+ or Zn2+ uptake regulation protein